MGDPPGEEGLFFIVDKWDFVDVRNLAVKYIALRPLDQLAAEIHPHRDFLVVRGPLVLPKLDRPMAVIGHRINLEITTAKMSNKVVSVMVGIEVIAEHGPCIVRIVTAPRLCHKAVDKALKGLVVLIDVNDLFSGILAHTHMDMEPARGVDDRAGVVEALAAHLKALETVGCVLKNRGHALNGGVAPNGAGCHELVIRPIVCVIVALIGEVESRGGASFYAVTADIAFNLYTEGENLAGEEPGELKVLDIAGTEAELDAHLLFLGERLAALLDGGQLILHGGHNTIFIYGPFTIGWPVTLIR